MTALEEALESDRPCSDLPRGRRRWPWIASGVLVAVVAGAGIVTAVFQFGLPWWMREGDRNHVYESDAGSLRYQVHLPPLVVTRLVAHWTAVGDLVDDGLLNDSPDPVEETTTVPSERGRYSYAHTTITAPDGTSLVESYLVQDMGHVWPGPAGDGTYIDHAGPDASAIMWDFAERHPKSSRSGRHGFSAGFSPDFHS